MKGRGHRPPLGSVPFALLLLAGCGAAPILGSPPPLAGPSDGDAGCGTRVTAPSPTRLASASINYSFEHSFDGWTAVKGRASPACGQVGAERLVSDGQPPVRLNPPGNYWKTPIDVGQEGECRIDTLLPRHEATELRSPEFTIVARYLSFRVGGDKSDGTSVELVDATPGSEASGSVLERVSGPGTLAMGSVTWDVGRLLQRRVRLVVRDDAKGPRGLMVDAIRDNAEPPPEAPAPLWGFADLHAHPLTALGFGRHLFFGRNDATGQGDPSDDDSRTPEQRRQADARYMSEALGSCVTEHGEGLFKTAVSKAGWLTGLFEHSPVQFYGHSPTGYPTFDGWPLSSTQMHQQMYIDWIRRAVDGGLRLMVAHAVNNEQLADSFGGTPPFDDTTIATVQIEGIKALAARHPKLMEIASTPADARRIIGSGRLAVVLGVEVDSLGNCRRDDDCTADQLRSEIRRLYELGVRHIFPVHLADNALGGSSVYKHQVWNLLSWFLRDKYQQVEHDSSVDYAYRPFEAGREVTLRMILPRSNLQGHGWFRPPYLEYAAVPRGHINSRGLTALGQAAVEEMMKLGMVIDIDHMGQNARADALRIAAAHQPTMPVVLGHTTFRELGYLPTETSDLEKQRHEALKTADEIEAVRWLGGVIAPIPMQGDIRRAAASGVATECAGTSTAWLQAYAYAVERMGGEGVGIGTDFNGFPGEPGPRFGPVACVGRTGGTGDDRLRQQPGRGQAGTLRDDAAAQSDGVSYDRQPVYAGRSRFYGGPSHRPYSDEERDIWQALTCFYASARPSADPEAKPDLRSCDPNKLGLKEVAASNVVALVEGFRGTSSPGALRAAAALVAQDKPPPASGAVRQKYDEIKGVQRIYLAMQSGNQDARLERYVAPNTGPEVRDFDVNLDGLAHYGLLPDFLQDVSNQLRHAKGKGATVRDLSAMFRSADSYVRMWEKVTSSSAASAAAAH